MSFSLIHTYKESYKSSNRQKHHRFPTERVIRAISLFLCSNFPFNHSLTLPLAALLHTILLQALLCNVSCSCTFLHQSLLPSAMKLKYVAVQSDYTETCVSLTLPSSVTFLSPNSTIKTLPTCAFTVLLIPFATIRRPSLS